MRPEQERNKGEQQTPECKYTYEYVHKTKSITKLDFQDGKAVRRLIPTGRGLQEHAPKRATINSKTTNAKRGKKAPKASISKGLLMDRNGCEREGYKCKQYMSYFACFQYHDSPTIAPYTGSEVENRTIYKDTVTLGSLDE